MIITIGRQHGSKGHEIARCLSQMLGIPSYSKEIVDEAAANSPFSKEIFASYDERRVASYIMPSPDYAGIHHGFQLNMEVANAQFDAVRSLADKGDGIFIGRCADYVLRSRPGIVRVFIRSDLPIRVRTIMERKGIDEDAAKKLIKQVDKDRASYYRYYTDQIWGEAANYDLVVDTGRISIEGAAQTILTFAEELPKTLE